MTDIASPGKLPVAADGASQDATIKSSPEPKLEPAIDIKAEDIGDAHPQTNGHVDADATPVANGHAPHTGSEQQDLESDRPSKRRRTQDSTPPPSNRKPKPVSPPWKKIEAEGPTSYTEAGRRKSGRINTIPLELQPQGKRRTTRGSLGSQNTPKQASKQPTTPASQRSRQQRRPSSSHDLKKPSLNNKSSSRSLRRRTPSPPPVPTRHSSRPSRGSRYADGEETTTPRGHARRSSQHETNRSPRIKLRVGRSGDIPLVHPDQVRKRPKIGENFEDFWTRAGDIPVEEGGLYASEDGPRYTDEMAVKDAQIIMRIEDEVEPGGVLAPGRCSLFAPEGAEDPPRQWARQDHMVKAALNFRKLLLMEQQRHRSTAKKLAEACRDEWIRRQPKSAEQLEAEAREACIWRYRSVVKTVAGLWENVRAQVNRNRLEQWEVEEQKRVKAALNEAVNLSEQKLQARQAGLDSELVSDEDDLDGMSDITSNMEDADPDSDLASNESNSEADSDVMSSDEETDAEDTAEAKDGGDEGLTQEQLRLKYANIPDLEPATEKEETSEATPRVDFAGETTDLGAETSDESVDMDDDMGSSDEASDEDEDEEGEDDSGDDDSESGSEGGGLLGLLFGKSELKKLKTEAPEEAEHVSAEVTEVKAEPEADTELKAEPVEIAEDDDDDLSLVGHNDFANGDIIQEDAKQAIEAANPEINEETAPKPSSNAPPSEEQEPVIEDITMADSVLAENADAGEVAEAAADAPVELDATPKSVAEETDVATNQPTISQRESPITADTQPTEADKPADDVEEVEDVVMKDTESGALTPISQKKHKTEIPFLLRGTLREYQHDGLDWLAGLYANNTNGILADEMGLGKTIQTIALLAHLACQHEVWGPHLVVVPTSVMLNWEMEFKKWCPGFKILAYYGTQEERKRKRQGWNNDDVWNVCITSYQLVLQDQQVFKRRRWHYMILDEAHNIKNFKSQRWQTLLGFNTHSRLLLTGTPLQNNLTELWSLLFFLMPAQNGVGGFADLQEFHDWFHKPESQILESGRDEMDDEARAIISKLHKVLRPYLLRRLKKDVEKQMPGKYEHVEFCRLSKRQRELYDGFLARSDTKDTLASGNYLSIINCLMQLRKVCNHPDLFVDRPIMTSFKMGSAVASNFEVAERRIRDSLLAEKPMSTVNLGFLNMIPTAHEHLSAATAERSSQLSSHRFLLDMREAQRTRAQRAYTGLEPATVASNVVYLESASRWGRFEELQHCVYLNALRRQQHPIYGKALVEALTIDAHKRPSRPKPKVPRLIMSWFENESNLINAAIPSLEQRADSYKTTIEKFSCVTPAVVTQDLNQVMLGRQTVAALTDEDLKLSAPVRWAPFLPKEPKHDPWHEARMRLSIQFPDKRLLQYDCGKLQKLDKLLRQLQSGGHRALIFTQMTKVLDILEQFLNIHGHKYLRLDGATKVEQRQILTDRFNHDPRILCFILSTRSGGLGINLTGADTVIFYDQDWNPAMDKQCQDRCHRIGQTRDVHIYRLVSEHTIEANILRKASQKQMLDDVVIQEGEFTTDHFNRPSVRDVLSEKLDEMGEGVAAADAALDRVLGGGNNGASESAASQRNVGRVLEQAEDREDVAAARVAEREIEADEAEFTEKPSGAASGASTTRQGTPRDDDLLDGVLPQDVEYNAWGDRVRTIDEFMLSFMAEELKYTKLELPKDKKKSKKRGKDTRKR